MSRVKRTRKEVNYVETLSSEDDVPSDAQLKRSPPRPRKRPAPQSDHQKKSLIKKESEEIRISYAPHHMPSSAERQDAREQVTKQQETMSALTRTEKAIERKIANAKTSIAVLREEIQEHLCTVSRGAFLAREILVEIFILSVTQGTSQWILSHVNRWWRRVAITTGTLWRKIQIRFRDPYPRLTTHLSRHDDQLVCRWMKQLKRIVKNSQREMLEIDLCIFESRRPYWFSDDESEAEEESGEDWTTRVVTFLDRLGVFRQARTLHVTDQSYLAPLGQTSFNGVVFPNLESLTITGSCPNLQSCVATTAGNLRRIEVGCDRLQHGHPCGGDHPLKWLLPCLTNLDSLHLDKHIVEYDQVLGDHGLTEIFPLFSHLRILSLTNANIKCEVQTKTCIEFSALKELKMHRTSIAWPLHLPHLERLVSTASTLSLADGQPIHLASLKELVWEPQDDFSGCFDCPNLQSLHIKFKVGKLTPDITTAISLEHLRGVRELVVEGYPSAHLLLLLTNCHFLKDLKISKTLLTSGFFEGIAGCSMQRENGRLPKSDPNKMLCPSLRTMLLDQTWEYHGYNQGPDAFRRRQKSEHALDTLKARGSKGWIVYKAGGNR